VTWPKLVRSEHRGGQLWLLLFVVLAIHNASTIGIARAHEVLSSESNRLAVQVLVADESGHLLDAAKTRASISRWLPGELATMTGHLTETVDAQSLRFILCGGAADLPRRLSLKTLRRNGTDLDGLSAVPLSAHATSGVSHSKARCVETPLIRVVPDSLEANAPGLRKRSIEGELGGKLQLVSAGGVLATLPVGGPREGDFDKAPYLATLRVRIVRSVPGGPPPMGRNDAEAASIMRQELRVASQLWSQCGFYFGDEKDYDIATVDPPEPFMVAVGCDFGLPASGGEVSLLVDDSPLIVPTRRKESPRGVALRLAQAAEKLGFSADVEKNPVTAAAALPTFDVSFRNRAGERAHLSPLGEHRVSTDATLGICVGDVDLEDGLDHFTNVDSMTGTLEERSLLRAIVDRDPRTIDVVVIESFSRSGRIGESFVSSDGGNLGNLILLNRAGLREGGRSFALAHELGHILLEYAGHPDDYGVDTPYSLMDSDAVDGTIFGPRHLTLQDCRRALVQSGPGAPIPILTAR